MQESAKEAAPLKLRSNCEQNVTATSTWKVWDDHTASMAIVPGKHFYKHGKAKIAYRGLTNKSFLDVRILLETDASQKYLTNRSHTLWEHYACTHKLQHDT